MLEKEATVENEEVLLNDTIVEEKAVIAESIEDILGDEVQIEEIEQQTEEKVNNTFTKQLLAGAVDQIVVMAGSLVALMLFGLILRLFGYYVVEKQSMFLIVYILINVIYMPVCKKIKFEETVGRKVLLNK